MILRTMCLIFFLFSVFSNYCKSQDINDRKLLKNFTSAYGYIEGQLIALKLIARDVPNLASKAFILSYSFKNRFGPIKDSIEVYMKKAMGERLVDSLKENISAEIMSLSNSFEYDEKSSQVKIEEIEKALNWKIQSPFLEYLLSIKYYHKPQQEFLDGHVQVFKVKGHAKSKGTNWQISVPRSWIASEAERPNIIQIFKPQSENGQVSISIIVKNLEPHNNQKPSKKEIDELFTEAAAKDMIPDDGKFLSFKKMIFDGINGGLMIYEQETERLDFKFYFRSHMFYFYWNEQLYYLICSVGNMNGKNFVVPVAEKYISLFKLVANSIVITSKYE